MDSNLWPSDCEPGALPSGPLSISFAGDMNHLRLSFRILLRSGDQLIKITLIAFWVSQTLLSCTRTSIPSSRASYNHALNEHHFFRGGFSVKFPLWRQKKMHCLGFLRRCTFSFRRFAKKNKVLAIAIRTAGLQNLIPAHNGQSGFNSLIRKIKKNTFLRIR